MAIVFLHDARVTIEAGTHRITLPSCTLTLSTRSSSVDVTDFQSSMFSPSFEVSTFSPIEIAGEAVEGPSLTDIGEVSDAQRLASAVRRGDEDAALLLADEVQLRYMQGDRFVGRSELERLLRDWYLAVGNMPAPPYPLTSLKDKTSDLLERLCRPAS